jgi:hypothetical protein
MINIMAIEDEDVINLCKFVSKSLVSEGVFYISTCTDVNIAETLDEEKNLFVVNKTENIQYIRKIYIFYL